MSSKSPEEAAFDAYANLTCNHLGECLSGEQAYVIATKESKKCSLYVNERLVISFEADDPISAIIALATWARSLQFHSCSEQVPQSD